MLSSILQSYALPLEEEEQAPTRKLVDNSRVFSCDFCRLGLAWFGLVLQKYMIEGSLEVKLPTICRDGKAEVGRVREEKSRSEKSREEQEWEARRCGCAKR